MSVRIRPLEARDEPRWRELWDGYCRFYEREPSEAITRHTWARIVDAAAPVHAIVAERADGRVIPRLSAVGSESDLDLVFADGTLPVRRADRGRSARSGETRQGNLL